MNRRHFLTFALWATLAALQLVPAARADDDWIATWTASPHEVWAPNFLAAVKVPRNLWGNRPPGRLGQHRRQARACRALE